MRKIAGESSAPAARSIPPLEEFRSAVKWILVNDHGMPELVAEEILSADADFLKRKHETFHADADMIAKTAEAFAYEPPAGVTWIRLEKGVRTAGEDQVVIDVGGELERYLGRLVALGLYGEDRDAVAKAMLARGIEAVFPLLHGKIASK